MFSCCFRRPRDSNVRLDSFGCFTKRCRKWISAKPQVQHLRPVCKNKARHVQGDWGKCKNDSAQSLNMPYNIWSPEAGLLEMLVLNVVPAHQKGDLFFVRNVLHNYRQWGTMDKVLDILFKKYRSFHQNYEEDEQVKNTLCSIFTLWLDFYPADFHARKNRDSVKELLHYATHHMPSSDLLLRLQVLLDELQETVRKERKKKRKQSLCRGLIACFGHRRAGPPDLPIKNTPVMSGMVMDGDLEPALDSRKHMQVLSHVDLPVPPSVNPCDTGEPAGTQQEEENDLEYPPVTSTVSVEQLPCMEVSTPLGLLDQLAPVGLLENVPTLGSGEPIREVKILDSTEESKSVFTDYLDKSVLQQEKQSPIDKVESAPFRQEGNADFKEEVDPWEHSEQEFLPEGNLEAHVDLEIPSPIPGKISVFLFALIVLKCSLYLFF